MTRFHTEVRIYYEDTDFSGAVYHANYLKFFERGRSDFLRAANFHHGENFVAKDAVAFVVQRADVTYRRRAGIDDVLAIETRVTEQRGARVVFTQTARRGTDVICEGVFTVACVDGTGRPRRVPRDLIDAMQAAGR